MAWRNGKIENSHFLLFEATGDSEVADSNNLGDIEGHDCDADAESCSCENTSDDQMLDFHEFSDCGDEDRDFNNTGHEDEYYCDDCKQRLADRMMGLSRGSFATAKEEEEEEEEEEEIESRFCDNGSVDILIRDDIDERERNRLFWETCLQVGYP